MPKAHSKRYTSALKVADLTKDYSLKEAIDILAKFPKAKFDGRSASSSSPTTSPRPSRPEPITPASRT